MKHRSPLEIEIKFRVPSIAEGRRQLTALSFSLVQALEKEISVLWDRSGSLQNQDSALRLRQHGAQCTLTFKGARTPDPLLKIRPEIEISVHDFAAAEALLSALGFTPTLTMIKHRELWEREGLEAALDETPFGCFIELEGPPSHIKLAMEFLCHDQERVERRSYPELFRQFGP